MADSSKFEKRGFGRICGLKEIDQFITDNGIDVDFKEKLIDVGIDITVVDDPIK